jgi:hypothetical protein
MALDTSIALNANAPQASNPLQQALQIAQFRAYNANGLAAQQQLAANRATSAAYQQSVDPTTGQLDTNKLSALIAANPDSAYNYAQTMKGVMDARQAQQTYDKGVIGLDNDKLDSAQKHLSWAYQTAGAVANNPNATTDDVMKSLSTAIQNKQITPQIAAQALADMPGADAPKGALQQWAANHVAQAAGQAQQLGIMLPKTGSIDKGGQILLTNTNPVSGDVTQTGSVSKTLDPATASSPVNVYDPKTGTNGIAPRGSLPGFGGDQPPPIPTVAQSPDMPASSGQAAPLPIGPAPGAPRGFVPTGPALGASGIADAAGQRYGALQTAAQQAPQMMKTYDLAGQAVNGAIAQGKGSASIASAGGVVQTILGAFGAKPTGDSVKDYQLATNYLNSAADQAASSLGLSGSDARVAAAKAGQPDPNNMNLPALQETIAHAKGLQQAVLDRQQATTNFLAQNGNSTANLNQFEAKWNKSFNPDVSYIRSLNTPQEQQAAMQQLKAQGKLGAWMKDYQSMKDLGAF